MSRGRKDNSCANGDRWAALPDALTRCIRDNRDGDAAFGEAAQPLIVEARNRRYEGSITDGDTKDR
jgi:hypothetical protein